MRFCKGFGTEIKRKSSVSEKMLDFLFKKYGLNIKREEKQAEYSGIIHRLSVYFGLKYNRSLFEKYNKYGSGGKTTETT